MHKPKNLIRRLPDGFEWRIEWAQDYPQDSSWMGDWSRKSGAKRFYINSRTGELHDWNEDHEVLMEVGKDNENFFEESLGWLLETNDGEYDWFFTEDKGDTGLYFRSTTVIRTELPICRTGNPFHNYWYPSDMRFSKNCEKEIAEYGLEAVLKDIIADYERHLAYVHDEWTFEYCQVTLVHEDDPEDWIVWDSLGGVESDRTKEYQIEVEEDCMWQAIDLDTIDSFIKGHYDDDYQEHIAEWHEWEIAVKAQRQAAYEAQQAEWAKIKAEKEQKDHE